MESEEPLYKEYNEVNFLGRLRDRIVNQGMSVIVEGAKDARIEHLEDLVFEKGTRGIRDAVEIMRHAAEDTRGTTTVKWDGKACYYIWPQARWHVCAHRQKWIWCQRL
jgi:hypothetical protein